MNILLQGSSHPNFALRLSREMGLRQADRLVSRFADGEIRIEIQEDASNCHVFVFQSTGPPVNDHIMELFLILNALKHAKVQKTTLITPYLGYSRQDRLTAKGSPVSGPQVIELLKNSGADKIITLDYHSEKILSSYSGFIQNISAVPFLAEQWKTKKNLKNTVCVSPDAGGRVRAETFAKVIGADSAFMDKKRDQPGQARILEIHGAVQNKHAVIVDDMIDTAGTLCTAVDKLLSAGAKTVSTTAVHGLLSGPAVERLEQSPIKEVWITDSLKPQRRVLNCEKIRVFPIASEIGKTLKANL